MVQGYTKTCFPFYELNLPDPRTSSKCHSLSWSLVPFGDFCPTVPTWKVGPGFSGQAC